MEDSFEKTLEQSGEFKKQRYFRIIAKFDNIRLTKEEKKYLLWLCGWDNDTERAFVSIFDKLRNSKQL